MMKSSQWTEALLAEVYARPLAAPAAWWEQSALIQVVRLPGVADRIKVLPNQGLNSYGGVPSGCSRGGPWSEGDLLVHFPGGGGGAKEAAFMQYWRLRAESAGGGGLAAGLPPAS